MNIKITLLSGLTLLLFASCSVKNSCELLEISNTTGDTLIIKYHTTTAQGVLTLPYIGDASNTPIVQSASVYNKYYSDIDILPLLTNEDLKNIIKHLSVYKVSGKDTVKLDVDCYDIEKWKLDNFVDDEIRAYYYRLNLD